MKRAGTRAVFLASQSKPFMRAGAVGAAEWRSCGVSTSAACADAGPDDESAPAAASQKAIPK